MRGVLLISSALVLAAAAGCGDKNKKSTEGGNPLNAPADYLGGLNQAKKLATKTVDLAQLQNAIGLFHGQEDRYPRDLNELVQQHYIAEVPTPPSGMRLTYNPATGEVKMLRTP